MTMAEHIKLHDLQESLFRAADRQGATGGDIFRAAPELRRAAFRLNSINESECNGVERWNPQLRRMLAEWNDSDQARADRLREKAENRVKAAMAVAFGAEWEKFFAIEFNGDPRGAPVKIHSANAERSHGIFCNSPMFCIW
ncbi:hypothetical protein RCPACIFIC_90 [Rhodobacter phage RcPacific]|nr:hypothetical protein RCGINGERSNAP_91 [Rhodobacter phage RcGingersnap]QXN71588.1 hypothetical protein RCIROH_89 [Rhodobacter phage RcIroh]QXN71760.1 hypothetical protein RCMCDREAMY_92 [Rhodobacter phage RcMcDreamy]QXN71861.1 hypothetical protein RCMRWORF_91 [Rhodobacter phage RcMrWorf]UUV43062.1 hypothetical protein RCAQUAPHINA_92 [Rhodobacter phage RcAquaphina]UUV43164.1 hypothetical protein RCBIGEAGLE_92 [Rhodobacter phage RcBigEagle]UUV44663.1 hypothetical protein RCPACIFIC_90 [Rhodobact